jgi:hypothetical protein
MGIIINTVPAKRLPKKLANDGVIISTFQICLNKDFSFFLTKDIINRLSFITTIQFF